MAEPGRIEGGPSRRDLIKGAVIAGTLAWTAPVIIDSLASPAAATTVATGCYRAFFPFALGTFTRGLTLPPGGGCVPTSCWNDAAKIDYPGIITVTQLSGPDRWRFTLDSPSCVILGLVGTTFISQGRTTVPNPQCVTVPPLTANTSTIDFPRPPTLGAGTNIYEEVKLVISCSGAACTACS